MSFQCFAGRKIFLSPRFPSHSSARCWPDLRGRLRPSEGLPWARSALSVTPDEFSGFVSFQCFVEWQIFASPRFPMHGAERCRPDVRGRLRPCEALPWARSALSVAPDGFSGFVSFQCFAERNIFAAPRFSLRGSERCRRRVRKTGMAGLVATWMTGTILRSSPGTVITERAALRAAEADHNAYGHMGSPVGECR
jgi:hypothetical protein